MNCPDCSTEMKPLFSGEYCPNDCDKSKPVDLQSVKLDTSKKWYGLVGHRRHGLRPSFWDTCSDCITSIKTRALSSLSYNVARWSSIEIVEFIPQSKPRLKDSDSNIYGLAHSVNFDRDTIEIIQVITTLKP